MPCLQRARHLAGHVDGVDELLRDDDGEEWVATAGGGAGDDGDEALPSITSSSAAPDSPAAAGGAGAGLSARSGEASSGGILGAAIVEDYGGSSGAAEATEAAAAPPAAAAPDAAPAAAAAAAAAAATDGDDDDDDFLDMAAFEEANLDGEDPSALASDAAAVAAEAPQGVVRATEPSLGGAGGGSDLASDVVATRTYDLHITYDKWYQTPRVWLFGLDEERRPLSTEAIWEDVMADYANKTVTLEAHPHLPGHGQFASIHPCRHAETMLHMSQQAAASGREPPPVTSYFFLFLKFIASVVPTINFDFTLDVAL